MVPQSPPKRESLLDWKQSLQQSIRTVDELLNLLKISEPLSIDIDPYFPLRVPREFVAKMLPQDPKDPLLLQILPLKEENVEVPLYTTNPVHDAEAIMRPGLIHKYPSKVLFTLTGACAVHCRFCFRRHYPYQENIPNQAQWEQNISYIQANPNIKEVIFSGGDPLSIADDKLAALVQMVDKIPHVQILRIHTRFPVMIPSRITKPLLDAIGTSRLKTVIALHINHPNEIDDHLTAAVNALKARGYTVINQAALLKGVNDNSDTLIELSYRLFQAGILPYYINVLDKVAGAHHFDIPLSEAKTLMQAQRDNLPGYLMPKWVVDVSGKGHKSKVSLDQLF
jgi:L-lysine 2,3-aminomutase